MTLSASPRLPVVTLGLLLSACLAACTSQPGGPDGGNPDAGDGGNQPAAAALSLTPAPGTFAAVEANAGTSEGSFEVANTGGSVSGAISLTIQGTDAPEFSVVGGTCGGARLQPGASCTITVRFTPTASGARSATLIASATPGGTDSTPLQATGLAPAHLDFAAAPTFADAVVNGGSSDATFEVTNSGAVASGAISLGLSGTNASDFSVTGGTCAGAALGAGLTCTVTVHFAPTGTGGARNATLTASASPGGVASTPLQAGVLTAAQLAFDTAPSSFGTVAAGTTTTQLLTLVNSGDQDSGPLPTLATSGDAAFRVVPGGGTCTAGAVVPGNGSCTLEVEFAPTSYGAKTGALTIVATPGGSATANLSGTGSQTFTLTVSNPGDGSGSITVDGTACALPCTRSYLVTANPAPTASVVAAADSTSDFTGWGGACSGTGACTPTMSADRTVDATFSLKRVTVTVNLTLVRGVTGAVHATSSPDAGIDLTCAGTVCSGQYPVGTSVTLTPSGDAGALFQSWKAGCPMYAPTCNTGPLTANFTATVILRPPINYVFVTSTGKPANTFGSDLAVADLHCDALAKAAGLYDSTGTTPTHFKAFLSTTASTTNISARARLGSARGWIRVDGREFADSPNSLFNLSGNPYEVFYPVTLNELGNIAVSYAATGTNKDGLVAGTFTCGDWTSTGSVQSGDPRAGAELWTSRQTNLNCTMNWTFYCFETAFSNPAVPTAPASKRYAFVTNASFTPGGGIAAADALCAAEQGSLPGTYKALLATTTASPASRFDLTGPVWVRPDGVQLATTNTDLMAWTLLAPIDQTAAGAYVTGFPNRAWVGSSRPNLVAPNTGANCTEWSTTSSTGFSSISISSTIGDGYASNSVACTTPNRIYCLQE